MGASLETVYQYRQLLAKCESSAGLTLEEIERLSSLEDLLIAPMNVELDGHFRGKKFVDPVLVESLGKSGALCTGCPFLDEGQTIELRIKLDDCSYRFAARVQWARECDDDTYEAGLSFEGAPVLVRNSRELPAFGLSTFAAQSAA